MCYIGCFVIINCVWVHYTAPAANPMSLFHFEMIPDCFAHSVFASLRLADYVIMDLGTAPRFYWLWWFDRCVNHPNWPMDSQNVTKSNLSCVIDSSAPIKNQNTDGTAEHSLYSFFYTHTHTHTLFL